MWSWKSATTPAIIFFSVKAGHTCFWLSARAGARIETMAVSSWASSLKVVTNPFQFSNSDHMTTAKRWCEKGYTATPFQNFKLQLPQQRGDVRRAAHRGHAFFYLQHIAKMTGHKNRTDLGDRNYKHINHKCSGEIQNISSESLGFLHGSRSSVSGPFDEPAQLLAEPKGGK